MFVGGVAKGGVDVPRLGEVSGVVPLLIPEFGQQSLVRIGVSKFTIG